MSDGVLCVESDVLQRGMGQTDHRQNRSAQQGAIRAQDKGEWGGCLHSRDLIWCHSL